MVTSDDKDNLANFSPSDDICGEYAGKWIAQLGNIVIASGDSIRDVIDAMPETEERPTVWHVPTSEQWKTDAWWMLYDDFGDSSEIGDDGPTVCTVHERFVPCRLCEREWRDIRATRWSSDPGDVAAVIERHSNRDD